MFNKSINSTMRDLKKSKSKLQTFPFYEQQKQNTLIQRYQKKLSNQKNQRRHFQLAQKIIMKQQLKDIVAHNVQYFRNILEAKELYKPNQHSLKLPTKLVPSLYRTEFPQRKKYQDKNSSVDMKKSFFERSKNFSQSKLPMTTTYQNEFKKIEQLQTKKNHRSNKIYNFLNKRQLNDDAPSFLDTQNSLQYRNWGTGAVMPSMKPSPKVATTDVPFKANSMYKTDFHKVSLPKTRIITQEQTYPQNIDLWMGNSSYSKDFDHKKAVGHSQVFKPKQSPAATNLPFKSTTQYKGSFIEQMKKRKQEKSKNKRSQIKKLSDQDIEKLVMQL